MVVLGNSAEGRIKRIITSRISTGTDLLEGLHKICDQNEVKTAVLVSCVGSLRRAEFSWSKHSTETKRRSIRTEPIIIEGPTEVLNAQGLMGIDRVTNDFIYHLHVTLCDQEGGIHGGHIFCGGNLVHSTMDVVLLDIEGVDIFTKFDDEIELNLINTENTQSQV